MSDGLVTHYNATIHSNCLPRQVLPHKRHAAESYHPKSELPVEHTIANIKKFQITGNVFRNRLVPLLPYLRHHLWHDQFEDTVEGFCCDSVSTDESVWLNGHVLLIIMQEAYCIPYQTNSKLIFQNKMQTNYNKTHYVVERFFGWLKNGFHRTGIRYERNAENYFGLINIASFLTCCRVLRWVVFICLLARFL